MASFNLHGFIQFIDVLKIVMGFLDKWTDHFPIQVLLLLGFVKVSMLVSALPLPQDVGRVETG